MLEMESNNKVVVKLNDIFDELREENKRLHNCLKVLNKFRELLNKISVKYETIIDSEDKQHFNRLEDEYNCVVRVEEQMEVTINVNVTQECEENEVSVKCETISDSEDRQELNTGVNDENQNNGHNFDDYSSDWKYTEREESSTDINDHNSMTTNEDNNQSKRVDPLIKNIKDKFKRIANKNNDIFIEEISDPNVISIPELKEELNSLLLLKRNNFDEKTQTYVCPHPSCDKPFQSQASLSQHFKKCHYLQKKHFCIHNDCNKSFKTAHNLRVHYLSHSDVRPFVCSVDGCNKGFKSIDGLRYHSVTHSKDRPFICTDKDCNLRFKRSYELERHQVIHSNTRPFICSFNGCDQRFIRSQQLKRHEVSHSDTTPFECSECQKSYKLDTDLKRHQLMKHKNILPSYKCGYVDCHQVFQSQWFLDKHKRLFHNSVQRIKMCDWPGCFYQTRSYQDIYDHKRRHTLLSEDNGNVTQVCEQNTVSVKCETISDSEDRHVLNTGVMDENNGHTFDDYSIDWKYTERDESSADIQSDNLMTTNDNKESVIGTDDCLPITRVDPLLNNIKQKFQSIANKNVNNLTKKVNEERNDSNFEYYSSVWKSTERDD